MARTQRREPEAVRITTAASSRGDDIKARQRRYLIAMAIRTVCFVSAIIVQITWLRWTLVAAALVLPYLAVIMANAVTTKSDEFSLLGGPSPHPELPPTAKDGERHPR